MTLFKEDLFFNEELKEEFEKLRKLQSKIKSGHQGRMLPVFQKRLDLLETIFGFFHKRQALLRAPTPKPFLFSEFRSMIIEDTKGMPLFFSKPEFRWKKDFYLPARIMDLKEALLSLHRSLSLAASEKIAWSFEEKGGSLLVCFSFRSGYCDFDLQGFCQKLVWQEDKAISCHAGFPVIEALLENCKGSFRWRYRDEKWNLTLILPILKTH
jgi:hypothetical protein